LPTNVKAPLVDESFFSSMSINVDVQQGVVPLSGFSTQFRSARDLL